LREAVEEAQDIVVEEGLDYFVEEAWNWIEAQYDALPILNSDVSCDDVSKKEKE